MVLRQPNQGPLGELELIAETTKENEAVFMTDPQIPAPDTDCQVEIPNKDLAAKILKTESQADEGDESPLTGLEKAMAG